MIPWQHSVHWESANFRALILSHRHSEVVWAVPFLGAFNFLSVATRYQFAVVCRVSDYMLFLETVLMLLPLFYK